MSSRESPLEPASSRRERRKRETRQRIRQAAAALFAEQGYEETKIADICARADVAHQTFFNHFPSKSDLLAELFRAGMEYVWETLELALREGRDTRERLRHFFGGLMGAAVDLGPRHREVVAAILAATADARRGEDGRRLSEAFSTLVERGRAEGDVTLRYDPAVLSPLVEGALGALVSSWTAGADFDLRRRALELADLVADALERRADERATAASPPST
jgi:AcrR family transcriptional regulator